MFHIVDSTSDSAEIRVVGVGGGGGNALKHMIKSGVTGVQFICANTDAQALRISMLQFYRLVADLQKD